MSSEEEADSETEPECSADEGVTDRDDLGGQVVTHAESSDSETDLDVRRGPASATKAKQDSKIQIR